MKGLSLLCAMLAIAIAHTGFGGDSGALTLVIIGDSTVANYPEQDGKRGWGQVIGDYLAPSVKVINLAECGRSTKTFFNTPLWQKALAAKGDYLFIQFGHNDSHAKDRPESTDANSDYQENLRRYVTEARQAGAKPVLVTPMHRLLFANDTGKITQELQPYADAMKKVAAETNAPVIDLYALSGKAFEPMGNSGVQGMTESDKDRTHFTEKGARIIAQLVAGEAVKIDPKLAK